MNIPFAWLYWNPDRVVFTIPGTDHPIVWYGLFFTLGCILGYLLVTHLLTREFQESADFDQYHILNIKECLKKIQSGLSKNLPSWKNFNNYLPDSLKQSILKKEISESDFRIQVVPVLQHYIRSIATKYPGRQQAFKTHKDLDILFEKSIASSRRLAIQMADRLTTTAILGIILGARIGHILFYGLPRYVYSPLDMFKIWEGGLASHGGVIGIILALVILYYRFRKKFPIMKSLIWLVDYIAIPAPLLGFFIRIGNFCNQEIIGYPTTVPWAIVFGTPFNGGPSVPRHPVQLYEAFIYLILFICLFALWKKRRIQLGSGVCTGILFTTLFTARFILEFYKEPQSLVINESILLMGQWLSLPCIFFGLFLIFRKLRKNRQARV